MDNLQRIALLIDADNTQVHKIEAVIREISTRGRIVVKRAYGNWKKDILKNWEGEIKRLAINANQQFDYVAGKNATDMALVIDAMDMLYKDLYDAFVIVASDSDYTPLAIRIHESGVYVIGVGEKKTPAPFVNACDEFILLENLEDDTASRKKKSKKTKKTSTKKGGNKASVKEVINDEPEEVEEDDEMEDIHQLLKIAYEKYADDDGYVNVASAGQYIKRVMPEFDIRSYHHVKLPELLADFPERYEIKKYPGKGTVTIIAYRCL